MLYDIVIIGAGITGSMLARELSRYELKVAVLDKEMISRMAQRWQILR